MSKLIKRVKSFLWKDESGATAVEYGLLVALIAVAIIGIVFTLGGTLAGVFARVQNELASRV